MRIRHTFTETFHVVLSFFNLSYSPMMTQIASLLHKAFPNLIHKDKSSLADRLLANWVHVCGQCSGRVALTDTLVTSVRDCGCAHTSFDCRVTQLCQLERCLLTFLWLSLALNNFYVVGLCCLLITFHGITKTYIWQGDFFFPMFKRKKASKAPLLSLEFHMMSLLLWSGAWDWTQGLNLVIHRRLTTPSWPLPNLFQSQTQWKVSFPQLKRSLMWFLSIFLEVLWCRQHMTHPSAKKYHCCQLTLHLRHLAQLHAGTLLFSWSYGLTPPWSPTHCPAEGVHLLGA